ncbi:wax synthase family protein [Aspergillus affinis]|uniref:wax synthase family protein n=1 Tax=Aspergillus affinis TaxID=1070780 RepID=UPI0022FE58A3|nr:putative toxin biosynthesis protein [Aspergillus affinis]KAI9044714.1 putative toxin biosynthesis protein [Aspergillus affinis]
MTSAFDVWRVPVAQWACMQLITAMAVGLTPSRSPLRSVAAVMIIALACAFQHQISRGVGDMRIGGPMTANCWVNVMNAMDLLVLSRISYEGQVTWEKKTGAKINRSGSILERVLCSVSAAFNYRRINTPWQINKLPRFDETDPSYVPSRGRFFLVGTAKAVWGVVLLALFTVETSDPHLPAAIDALPRDELVLLPWVYAASARRLLLLIAFTTSFAICCRAFTLAVYNSGAVIAVGLGIHDPSAWPPFSGSLLHGWSLRRLWGISWHQSLRALLSSNADMIASSVLCIPRSSKWVVYPRLVIAFTLSGLFHSGMDVAFGINWEESGAIWFFMMQAVGILVESAFQHVCRGWIGRLSPVVRRGLGYVWVCIFLLWTTPVWMIPMVRSVFADGTPVFSPFLMFKSWAV